MNGGDASLGDSSNGRVGDYHQRYGPVIIGLWTFGS
jgi:hypothetical protein